MTFSKLNTMLSDSSKFKPIMSDIATHLLKLEDKLNRLLRSIKTSIGEMTISGSKPGRLYGLPKIYKIGQPLRPIISAIGTFNYNVAKFLVQIITLLTTNEYTIENFSFIKEISDLKPLRPVTMVDGVTVGSPLSPCYANTFLCHHEQAWINECPANFKLILYRRYMDDTFLLFDDPSHINPFLSCLNSQHPNIKFTFISLDKTKLNHHESMTIVGYTG
nr:uncharacterized protein LOC113800843 [Penaeus vannamei]